MTKNLLVELGQYIIKGSIIIFAVALDSLKYAKKK